MVTPTRQLTRAQMAVAQNALPALRTFHTGKWGWRRVSGCLNLNACSFRTQEECEAERDAKLAQGPGRWDPYTDGVVRHALDKAGLPLG